MTLTVRPTTLSLYASRGFFGNLTTYASRGLLDDRILLAVECITLTVNWQFASMAIFEPEPVSIAFAKSASIALVFDNPSVSLKLLESIAEMQLSEPDSVEVAIDAVSRCP